MGASSNIAFLEGAEGRGRPPADHAQAADPHRLDAAAAQRRRKAEIARALEARVWPLLESGKIKPQIYRTFPLAEAAEAHGSWNEQAHIGKIVLVP